MYRNALTRNFICASTLLFLATTFLESSHAQQDDDWPQWRGPDRNDISSTSGTLDAWPAGGPKQLWVAKNAGLGYSGFSIVDDQLFTMGEENGRQFVICLDAQSGNEKWTTETGGGYENGWGNGPRSTPTVDGDHLYALDASGVLVCLKVNGGQKVWSTDLRDFGGSIPKWGYSESVLVDGDQVVCTPGGKDGAIMALDKKTGKKLWQMNDNTEIAHYSSIIKAEINGQPQYIQLMEKAIVGVSTDGKLLWSSEWPGSVAVIPTPIVEGNKVYVTSGYGVGSKQIEIQDDNEVKFVWYDKGMKNHHGGAILFDGHVYGYSDSVGWVCQNWDTGEIVWRNRKDLNKGAIGYADGKFICVEEDSGTVAMIKASSDEWEELGRFTLTPQTQRRKRVGKIWVHPVVVDGKLYLRDQELIYCYDIAK